MTEAETGEATTGRRRQRSLLDAKLMYGETAAVLYQYADSISLNAQFFLIDEISGTDLDEGKLLDRCASKGATCSIGDGTGTVGDPLALRQLLSRTDTIRPTALLTAAEVQDSGATGVTVVYVGKVEIVAEATAIADSGESLEGLAASLTATNEAKMTDLRDNTPLQGTLAFESQQLFPPRPPPSSPPRPPPSPPPPTIVAHTTLATAAAATANGRRAWIVPGRRLLHRERRRGRL